MPIQSFHLLQLINCKILRNHCLIEEHLWIRDGKIVDPEAIFFNEKIQADKVFDCQGAIVAPGFIDLQINGAFGVDFSFNTEDVQDGLERVSSGILSHGVTSFCPTLVTSPKEVYTKVIQRIVKKKGGKHGATVLGLHLEGPFINKEKKGAHPEKWIIKLEKGFDTLVETYGNLENVKIVTLAPELENAHEVIQKLSSRNIAVSLGHSMANLSQGENAVSHGATFITHLFNAMLPFHHRDPGLVGLLASNSIPKDKIVYFGIIADGIHTHPSALRIAYRTHPDGLVLVTDAVSAMGLEEGRHNIGQMAVEIRQGRAYIMGTNTLCGSIATLNKCVKLFKDASGCTIEYALEAASLHPALALGISDTKGTLNYGADADFVLLDPNLNLISTWIAGECVWEKLK